MVYGIWTVFFVQKTFFCRELGIIAHGDAYGTSFHFNTTLSYENLNKKDKINMEFLQQQIHGLSLSDKYQKMGLS